MNSITTIDVITYIQTTVSLICKRKEGVQQTMLTKRKVLIRLLQNEIKKNYAENMVSRSEDHAKPACIMIPEKTANAITSLTCSYNGDTLKMTIIRMADAELEKNNKVISD